MNIMIITMSMIIWIKIHFKAYRPGCLSGDVHVIQFIT